MENKTLMNVELMLVEDLIMNEMASKIYSKPKNYEAIKQSIIDNDIMLPLQINEKDNMIISGNLRYSIAKELNMEYVPIIKYQLMKDEDINELLLQSNTHREKSLLDKYNEYQLINGLFSYGQGARVDLNPEKQKEKKLKTEAISILSAAEIDYFGRINSLAKKKFGVKNYEEKITQGLEKIDNGEITRNAFKLSLDETKSPQLFLSKEVATKKVLNTLSRVPGHLQEEILLDIWRNFYSMAS
jgi:hypothetical protein